MMRPPQFIHPDGWRPPNGHSQGANRPRRAIGAIEMPAKALVGDGDRITIDDGIADVIYEMDPNGDGCTFPGAICVDLSAAVSAVDCSIALSNAIQANNHIHPVSQLNGVFTFQTLVYKADGGIGTTGANIVVTNFHGGSLGNDCIPIRWGLSRGVFVGGSLTC